uniref:Cell division protein n=1 Tax=Spirogyra maxima TaxID=3180 RepID=A0A191T4E6_SPIMX|nr:cell division protein [Spirogyra maxima]ANI25265.1 cell division protein [Spirogyra maxima]
MEEDGEEFILKIKENDIFRRQKPGTISFLKRQEMIHYENGSFLGFRQLKRKTRSFFRIFSLFILSLVIYRVNQKLIIEPGLPKLAYIMCNSNTQSLQDLHNYSSNNVIRIKNPYIIQQFFQQKNRLIHPSHSDCIRVTNLWNANQLKQNLKFKFINRKKFKKESTIFNINSLLFANNKIYDTNQIFQYSKQYVFNVRTNFCLHVNEANLSQFIYQSAFFLIKPTKIYWKNNIKQNNMNNSLSFVDNNLLLYKSSILKKIQSIQDQFIGIMKELNNQYLVFNSTQYIVFFKKIEKFLNINNKKTVMLIYCFIKKILYNIEESNQFFEEDLSLNQKHLMFKTEQNSLDSIYIDQLMFLVEDTFKHLIDKCRNYILNFYLKPPLEILKIPFQDLNSGFKYVDSIVNVNDRILFSKEVEPNLDCTSQQITIDNSINSDLYNKYNYQCTSFLAPHLYLDNDNYLFNEFDTKQIDKSLFVFTFECLEHLYSIPTKHFNQYLIDYIDNKVIKVISLFDSHLFNKNSMMYQSTQSLRKMLVLNNEHLNQIKYNVKTIVFNEQDKINLIWKKTEKSVSNYLDTKYIDYYNNNHSMNADINPQFISVDFVKSMDFEEFTQKFNMMPLCQKKTFLQELYPLHSKNLWQSLAKIFKSYINYNDFFKLNSYASYDKTNIEMFNFKHQSELVFNPYKGSIFNLYFKNQINIIKQYIPWFFTSEWWLLIKSASKKVFLLLFQDISDYLYLKILPVKTFIYNKFNIVGDETLEYSVKKVDNSVFQMLTQIHNFFFKQLLQSLSSLPLSAWEDLGLSSFRIDIWSYFGIIISFVSSYWFSFILGGSSFILWVMFERIKDLTTLSWNTELDLLVLINRRQNKNFNFTSEAVNKKNKLKTQYYFSLQKWSVWLRLYFSKTIGSVLQTVWLYNTSCSDIYIGQRQLGFELAVGETGLSKLTLYNLDSKTTNDLGYQSIKQEGLNYLKQISKRYNKWYTNEQYDFLSHQRFISFAFYKRHSASEELWKLDNLGFTKQKSLPISLELSDLYSRGLLLIGPKDTGKSYVVKSLAQDAELPLIYIAIDKLIDIVEFEDLPLESHTSLYFLRENIIKYYAISNFIKSIGPSIVWISNIENIYDLSNLKSKTKEDCRFLILRYLLIDITTILANNKNIMFLASCEDTSYLDPGFISEKRLNKFINLRMPENLRRPQIFEKLLKNQGLEIKSALSWYSEFSNNTMGFSLRDLTALANEAFLISIQTQSKSLRLDDVRLVLYRGLQANQSARIESWSKKNEIIQYKIGRAIIQTTLVRPNRMTPLRLRYDLWKPRFYYLSKAYLQLDSSESTVTQFKILPHILNCLAGSAARDAWLFVNKTILKEDSFYWNTEIEHDLDLAVNLFESIFKEFVYLDIFDQFNNKLSIIPDFKRMDDLVLIDQANYQSTLKFSTVGINTFSFEQFLENILPDTVWCSRTERLGLSRNILFDLLKRVDESSSLFSSLRLFGKVSLNTMLTEIQKPHIGQYNKSWDAMKSGIPKDLDYTFYGMISKQRIKTMGLPIQSEQLMEYAPPENDALVLSGKPMWNPTGISIRNLVFRQRHLFANEEFLSLLYLVYQTQRNRSGIFTKTRRKELWTPDEYLEKLAMDKNPEQDLKKKVVIQVPHTFNMFRRLAYANATFQRPQTELISNSEISFLKRFIASNRFSRFSFTEDIFAQTNTLSQKNVNSQELLTYSSILESYYYLFQFFIKKQYLLKK